MPLPTSGRPTALGGLTLVALSFAGCAGDAPEFRTDGAACEIELETRAVLGAAEDPASVRGGLRIQVAQLPSGGWAVAEDIPPSPAVLRYDSSGAFAGSMGATGSGPLELSSPLGVRTDPRDSIWVADSRQRWVVFGPDGEPAREVQAPGRGSIQGFTPEGAPFQVYRTQQPMADGSMVSEPVVLVWSRDGEPVDTVGPGRALVRTGAPVGPSAGSVLVASSDSTFVYPRSFAGEQGVAEWRGGTESLWLPFESLVAGVAGAADGAVAMADDLEDRITTSFIVPDGRGGVWIMGRLRRLSTDEVRALGEELGLPPPPGNEPLLKHAASDGVLWHIAPDRSVTAVRIIDQVPEGVSGVNEFFVLEEDIDTGLRTLRVMELGLGC